MQPTITAEARDPKPMEPSLLQTQLRFLSCLKHSFEQLRRKTSVRGFGITFTVFQTGGLKNIPMFARFDDKIDVPNAPARTFRGCLISINQGRASNGESHLKMHHKQVYQDAVKTNGSAGVKPRVVASVKSKSADASALTTFLAAGNSGINDQVHAAIATLVVNQRLALSFAVSQYLTEVIELALQLKPGSYKPMTRGKMNAALISMFSGFISSVRTRLVTTRAMFCTDGHAKPTGWLIVCHDGWDSTIKQFFGVLVYWIDPHSWQRFKVACARSSSSRESFRR